eukprot:CAMPEP_0170642498 /NCGR_PEP_ID=MMETSP0224-20130122/41358_1 /TAXON_ID=285029 /ORGANISM="Togula jolla, Strain CCCM 725" /LENGTH=222 /DNA_ID=CAMNT_0010973211 /DNA_START=820 /DNA_END=1486 /DNA_ORIENTATION=-
MPPSTCTLHAAEHPEELAPPQSLTIPAKGTEERGVFPPIVLVEDVDRGQFPVKGSGFHMPLAPGGGSHAYRRPPLADERDTHRRSGGVEVDDEVRRSVSGDVTLVAKTSCQLLCSTSLVGRPHIRIEEVLLSELAVQVRLGETPPLCVGRGVPDLDLEFRDAWPVGDAGVELDSPGYPRTGEFVTVRPANHQNSLYGFTAQRGACTAKRGAQTMDEAAVAKA